MAVSRWATRVASIPSLERAPALLIAGALFVVGASATASGLPSPVLAQPTGGVRPCELIPGKSRPAKLSRRAVAAAPTPATPPTTLPGNTSVPPETTEHQSRELASLRDVVSQNYFDPEFNGNDWSKITDRYASLVQGGLTDEDFYAAMGMMIAELGDEHSYFQSPDEVAAEDARIKQGADFVGIGIVGVPIAGTRSGVVVAVFPGSPAAEAGLRPHDRLLEVDGLPYLDIDGEHSTPRSRGPAGTTFDLEYRRPGERARTVSVTRRAVTGFTPVDSCIVPNTRIGYVLLPTFLDESIDDQVRTALQAMTADGPLDGLVLDNRLNGGGLGSVTTSMLGLFTSGGQGAFVARSDRRELDVTGEDVGGSQAVPLVILAGPDTVSYAEVFTGVLQHGGRARVVGARTRGNVETLHSYTSETTGSRLWLATETFEPTGSAAGAWEGGGVTPDVRVPTRWDLITEATDPALARAVTLLRKQR